MGLNETRRGAQEGHCSSDVPPGHSLSTGGPWAGVPWGSRALLADKLTSGCRDTTADFSRDKRALVSYWIILSWKLDWGPPTLGHP